MTSSDELRDGRRVMDQKVRDIARPNCPKCGRPVGGVFTESGPRLRCTCGWQNYKKESKRELPKELENGL